MDNSSAHSESGTMTTNELKRKRSPSADSHAQAHAAPAPKSAKTHNNHLQINYLARQYNDDLPLVANDDTLPSILALLSEYQGVLERHESLAGNLGARPLGPILIKRFERLFDGPPKVLKCHGKEGTMITWLDVVEFARNKPEQFSLSQMSEGLRVCQFYTKQCRVQISEEDYVLIDSGIPQKMIPPQPIVEDEEKELGTLEILEKNLGQISHLADQVSARTRQLNHRIKLRKQAILDRRATEPGVSVRATSPSNVALMNGHGLPSAAGGANAGFVAVNNRPDTAGEGVSGSSTKHGGASPATKQELMGKFFTLTERRIQHPSLPANELRRPASLAPPSTSSGAGQPSLPPVSTIPTGQLPHEPVEQIQQYPPSIPSPTQTQPMSTAQAVAIPSTPASLLPSAHASASARGTPVEKDDGGPFKAEMVARMEGLSKGDRIMPPCDRCRRLHMDCLKNLTACMGCTKKHAKCGWKEVREDEVVHGEGPSTQSASGYGPPPGYTEASHLEHNFGGRPSHDAEADMGAMMHGGRPIEESLREMAGAASGDPEQLAAVELAQKRLAQREMTPDGHMSTVERSGSRQYSYGAPEARMTSESNAGNAATSHHQHYPFSLPNILRDAGTGSPKLHHNAPPSNAGSEPDHYIGQGQQHHPQAQHYQSAAQAALSEASTNGTPGSAGNTPHSHYHHEREKEEHDREHERERGHHGVQTLVV
ncbi:hypothetical protein K402DRAFT_421159 [Aulographum hederae CBS 113979]|uniref:Zn(2)-C6 fungal-type domain-containing protein n=1 Tax=Aulographum hederae CBS 113979 TaxID=1176131 RepID=A0A6G1GZC0_9PEZI|nr:hypothetical protein K402DRAFT_421159 [Aulographum hederae CBS 113979]